MSERSTVASLTSAEIEVKPESVERVDSPVEGGAATGAVGTTGGAGKGADKTVPTGMLTQQTPEAANRSSGNPIVPEAVSNGVDVATAQNGAAKRSEAVAPATPQSRPASPAARPADEGTDGALSDSIVLRMPAEQLFGLPVNRPA